MMRSSILGEIIHSWCFNDVECFDSTPSAAIIILDKYLESFSSLRSPQVLPNTSSPAAHRPGICNTEFSLANSQLLDFESEIRDYTEFESIAETCSCLGAPRQPMTPPAVRLRHLQSLLAPSREGLCAAATCSRQGGWRVPHPSPSPQLAPRREFRSR